MCMRSTSRVARRTRQRIVGRPSLWWASKRWQLRGREVAGAAADLGCTPEGEACQGGGDGSSGSSYVRDDRAGEPQSIPIKAVKIDTARGVLHL